MEQLEKSIEYLKKIVFLFNLTKKKIYKTIIYFIFLFLTRNRGVLIDFINYSTNSIYLLKPDLIEIGLDCILDQKFTRKRNIIEI